MNIDTGTFKSQILAWLEENQPGLWSVAGDGFEIIVAGRPYDFENLWNACAESDDAEREETIGRELRKLFPFNAAEIEEISWNEARPLIMPMIQPVSILGTFPRHIISQIPYADGLLITFVMDLPELCAHITEKDREKWGVNIDDLSRAAMANLSRSSEEVPLFLARGEMGGEKYLAASIGAEDQYNTSRILLPGMRARVEEHVGRNPLWAMPNQGSIVACSGPDAFIQTTREQVAEHFLKLANPLCRDFLLVRQDGEVLVLNETKLQERKAQAQKKLGKANAALSGAGAERQERALEKISSAQAALARYGAALERIGVRER